MTTQDVITQAVKSWMTKDELLSKDVAEMLELNKSGFSRRLSGHRRWSITDIDRLITLGVIEPVAVREPA